MWKTLSHLTVDARGQVFLLASMATTASIHVAVTESVASAEIIHSSEIPASACSAPSEWISMIGSWRVRRWRTALVNTGNVLRQFIVAVPVENFVESRLSWQLVPS